LSKNDPISPNSILIQELACHSSESRIVQIQKTFSSQSSNRNTGSPPQATWTWPQFRKP